MHTTDDPSDPRLTRGPDTEPREQAEVYLVLSDADRARGFTRPLRASYRHIPCGEVTTMATVVAATFARDPASYGSTYCVRCGLHRPVGEAGEFVWLDDGSKVGT